MTGAKTVRVGRHGERFLELIYLFGGGTVEQLSAFAGVSEKVGYRTLAMLLKSRLVERTRVSAGWLAARGGKPKDFYYGRPGGIEYGAFVHGEENAWRARRAFNNTGQPRKAPHAAMRNDYLRALMCGASVAGAVVYEEEMAGESSVAFPLIGPEMPVPERKNARLKYAPVHPDGEATVAWPGVGVGDDDDDELRCRFLVEVETDTRRLRTREILDKIDRYAGAWARIRKEDAEEAASELDLFGETKDPGEAGKNGRRTASKLPAMREGPDGPWPVVFVEEPETPAKRMRNKVRDCAKGGDPRLSRYSEWSRAEALAGRLFVFSWLRAPVDWLRAPKGEEVPSAEPWPAKKGEGPPTPAGLASPFAVACHPLAKYPDELGGWEPKLEDVARLIAGKPSKARSGSVRRT